MQIPEIRFQWAGTQHNPCPQVRPRLDNKSLLMLFLSLLYIFRQKTPKNTKLYLLKGVRVRTRTDSELNMSEPFGAVQFAVRPTARTEQQHRFGVRQNPPIFEPN